MIENQSFFLLCGDGDILRIEWHLCKFSNHITNKPKGLEVAKEDQIAHMPYGR